MVNSDGSCDVTNSRMTGGRFGVGLSLTGSARVKNCTIKNSKIGVSILANHGGEVVLDDVTINDCK